MDRNQTHISDGPVFDLPPPFRLVTLREVGDAFAYGRANAAELGAGTLIFVGRFNVAEFAVVLEPDEPFASARLAFYAGMIALGDALAALAPPEKPIEINWPDAIRVDGGLVGGGRLAWPDCTGPDAVPDWLVFGATIRTVSMSEAEPGSHPLATTLEDEGFDDLGSERILEGFARHFMVAIDRWRDGGFAPIAKQYVSKLEPESGANCCIEQNGDLSIQRAGKPIEHRKLVLALREPSWLNVKTAEPHL